MCLGFGLIDVSLDSMVCECSYYGCFWIVGVGGCVLICWIGHLWCRDLKGI